MGRAQDGPSYLKGLTVKGGKFVTLLGAEVVEPWLNFNNSRSLICTFSEPVTEHRRAVDAIRSPTRSRSRAARSPAGTPWHPNNNGWSGMGGVTWVATDQVTLAANAIGGPSQNNNVGNKRVVGDFIATVQAAPIRSRSAAQLRLRARGQGGPGPEATPSWMGASGIVSCNFTDRFTTSGRLGFFNDTDGARTGAQADGVGVDGDCRSTWSPSILRPGRVPPGLLEPTCFRANTRLADTNPLVGIYATYVFN